MPIPFLDLQAQYQSIKPEVDAAMQKVLDSSQYVLGPAVEQFERDFAAYCEVDHCVGLNSGTAALALLMQAYGIGHGDEVITVANSFFASASAISQIGATPILVDCREEDGLMNPDLIEAVITDRTKAIMPVHLFGQCADMDALNAIAKKHELLVIEDACQAHGATYNGKKAGNLGDAAAFSFYPGKNLGAFGDAGAAVTNDAAIAEKVRMLREHGMRQKYKHEAIGWTERMDGLQGAVLGVKLKHLDAWNAKRAEHVAHYRKELDGVVRFFDQNATGQSANHLCVIRHPQRDALQKYLMDKGIHTIIHYPTPIHLQPAYANMGWSEGSFPVAEILAKEILSLPLYPEMTEEQTTTVCTAIKQFS